MLKQTLAFLRKQLKFILLFILLFSTPFAIGHSWRELAPGVEYMDLGEHLFTPWSHVHVFRIDLKKNQLGLVMANFLSQPHASVDEFARFSKALIAINGGFFDQNHQALGLRISHQQQHNPLKRISWWGIFYVRDQKPQIASLRGFKYDKQIDFAVQSGPRLLINGKIPTLKPGRDERSALGITQDGHVIILATDNAPLTTTSLAELMKAPPLNCKNALNLDGGSSSQLSAHIGRFALNVYGLSNVSDAIIVKAR